VLVGVLVGLLVDVTVGVGVKVTVGVGETSVIPADCDAVERNPLSHFASGTPATIRYPATSSMISGLLSLLCAATWTSKSS